jgi:hypothetical protein
MPEISIISYLRYLHDISRKILQRGGFENVLYGKPKKQHPYYFNFDQRGENLSTYLRLRNTFLQSEAGKGLFLGMGLITGKLETRTRKRNICAPLLFCAVELVSDEEDPTHVEHAIIWNSITLNYDLITLILEHASHDEPEDVGDLVSTFVGSGEKIDPAKLIILTDIETELDRNLDQEKYQEELLQGEKIDELMCRLKEKISDFRSITPSPTTFEYAQLKDYIVSERLRFFRHRFFFVAPVADQLSTTVALRELIRQTE